MLMSLHLHLALAYPPSKFTWFQLGNIPTLGGESSKCNILFFSLSVSTYANHYPYRQDSIIRDMVPPKRNIALTHTSAIAHN